MVTDVKLVQPEKADSPIEAILSGMVIDVKLLQSLKVSSSIEVIPSEIVIEVSPEQPEYLQPVITQYFASNKSEIWS